LGEGRRFSVEKNLILRERETDKRVFKQKTVSAKGGGRKRKRAVVRPTGEELSSTTTEKEDKPEERRHEPKKEPQQGEIPVEVGSLRS